MHNRPQNLNKCTNTGLPGTDLSRDPSLVDWVAVDVVLPAPSLTCSNTGPAPPPRALPPPASDGDDWLPALPPALKAGANCPAVRYAGVNMPRRPPGRPMSTPLSSLPPSPSLLRLRSLRSLELPPSAICSMLGAADAANHRCTHRWRWGGHGWGSSNELWSSKPLLPPKTCTLRPKEASALTGSKTERRTKPYLLRPGACRLRLATSAVPQRQTAPVLLLQLPTDLPCRRPCVVHAHPRARQCHAH